MKSKISFCDLTILKKNLTRFAPAWALYGIVWMLMVILMLDGNQNGLYFAQDMATALQSTPIINMGYALLCAQLLFGDLYNSRMCNALHALPLRRETWFCTHVISGLVFSLLPNFLICLLSISFMGSAFVIAPLWLLVNTLQFMFFFGVAVFSAYCVGNRFAMAMVYAIINFISIILFWLISELYVPQLYGLVVNSEPFSWFCPVVYMTAERAVRVFSTTNLASTTYQIQIQFGLWYSLICGGVGLGFIAMALLLYRKRNLECAGDFVSVKAFAPVFLILYCLCAGTVAYLISFEFVGNESMFFLLVGIAVGWFTGRMLLERTVRVFRVKAFIYCGVFLAVFFGSLLLARLDPIGITRWIPKTESVAGLHIQTGGSRYDYYRNGDNYLDDPQAIEDVLAIHRYGIENRDADTNGKSDVHVSIDYVLRSGITVSRQYAVDIDTPEIDAVKMLMSRSQIVFGIDATDAAGIADALLSIETPSGKVLYGEDMIPLIEAILKDCEAGNMAQNYSLHNYASASWLSLQLKTSGNSRTYRDLTVYATSVNTIQYLKENNYLDQDQMK